MNNQNLIIDFKDITTESGIDEPVTVQEAKDFMRLEGFVDVDESTTESLSNFSSDDSFISSLITAARKRAEKFLGVSIVFHTWKVLLTNNAGDIELPFGPVQEFTSLTTKDGTAYDEDNIKLRGFDFQILESPTCEKLIAIYDAGYEDVPEEIVLAIKQMVWFWYANRGEDAEVSRVIPAHAEATLWPFKRPWTYVG